MEGADRVEYRNPFYTKRRGLSPWFKTQGIYTSISNNTHIHATRRQPHGPRGGNSSQEPFTKQTRRITHQQ